MKKTTLFINLILLSCLLLSQPTLNYVGNYGGSDADYINGINYCENGDILLIGVSQSTDYDMAGIDNGSQDILVVKLNNSGTILDTKSFGGSGSEGGNTILELEDGYVLAGSTWSNDGDISEQFGLGDYWLVRLDQDLNILWEQSYGGSGADNCKALIKTSDNGFLLAGYSYSSDIPGCTYNPGGWNDALLFKLDQDGVLEWAKMYGGTGDDAIWDVAELPDGGYVYVGHSGTADGDIISNYGNRDVWVVRLDSDGEIVWQKNIGGSEIDTGLSVFVDDDSNIVVSGEAKSDDHDLSSNYGWNDVLLIKLNINGDMLWIKNYGGSDADALYSSADLGCGQGYVFAGSYKSPTGDFGTGNGSADMLIFRTDIDGNITWYDTYGGTNLEIAYAMDIDPTGGYCIGGYTMSDNGDVVQQYGNKDFWIAELEEDNIYHHSITFTITDGSLPIENAQLTINGNDYFSDEAGIIVVSGLCDNDYTYTVTADGFEIYSNSATVNGDNQDIDVSLLSTNSAISISEEFNMYPNPSNGLVYFSSDVKYEKHEVFSINSKKICEFNECNFFDISNLPAGIYLIKSESKSGYIKYNKLNLIY